MAEMGAQRKPIAQRFSNRRLLLFLAVAIAMLTPLGKAQQTAMKAASEQPSPPGDRMSQNSQTLPSGAYTLSPDKLAKAARLARERLLLDVGSMLWSILVLFLMLANGGIAVTRDWAASVTAKKWLQGFLFLPALIVLLVAANLPLDILGHHISLAYGLSIQRWGSWFWDWTKSLLLLTLGGTLAVSLLFAIVRRSERRWWFWFWLIAQPLQVLLVLILPVVIDPIFNHFEPLAKTNPALVDQLERVVARSDLRIPPSRMFLMRASDKVTELNAYVTGFGASKRLVVWDTTIRKAAPDQILFIFGHEQGHYVLDHIWKGMLFSSLVMFFFLLLGYHLAHRMVRRYGESWKVSAMNDWAAVGVLLFIFSVFGFISEPITNSFSRVLEHHADIYGQEVIHGLVANPQLTASQAFQVLGEISLDDPSPSRLVEFWLYSHPSITHRMAFAARYDPWQADRQPKFFAKDIESR